jgi:TolA-binding protein
MPNMRYLILFSISFFAASTLQVYAQKNEALSNNQRIYNRAIELFNHAQYGEAQRHFLMYATRTNSSENKINAEYYAGLCAMELLNPDAVNLLLKIATQHTDHAKSKPALFQLGKYYYRIKDNKNAIKFLSHVNAEDLTPEEANEMLFIRGYCYFRIDDFDNSKNSLNPIADKPNKFNESANYYLGYIIYREGSFDEALNRFEKVGDNKLFGALAQVYIAQIYFAQKRYNDVVTFADTITQKEIINDVAGIVGQSYFQLGNYEKAIPFLERFYTKSPSGKTSHDIYRLGFSHLRLGNYNKAIELLGMIASEKDSTSQFASYHLAEAYLATNQKRPARLAFDRAYQNSFNTEITELALFNRAKLSYELAMQNEALKDLAQFVNEYPSSEWADDAKSLFSQLLTATKNYKDAIPIIESIKNPNQPTQLAYQRVCYYRAEELYLNNDYNNAKAIFIKSQTYNHDKKFYSLASFWLGEIAFKEGNYKHSIKNFNDFLKEPEVKETRFYALAHYNLAYANLKIEAFDECISWMKKFTSTEYGINNSELYTDANIRIADCYLVLREYQKALEQYDIIVKRNLNGADYALYQQATIYGVLNMIDEKITKLNLIVNQHKRSMYMDDAIFDIAVANMQNERFEEAIVGFDRIISDFSRSKYLRKAIQNKGLCYYNSDKDEYALTTFRKLIVEHAGSQEARDGLLVVKNIFVNRSDADGYLEFVKILPNVVLEPAYQDSVTFESAFNAYKANDCEKAAKQMSQYLQRFPGGFFNLKAHWYRAECDFILKNYDSALVSYEFVATQLRSEFTEKAIKQSAVLYFMNKKYDKALDYYASLERIASSRDNLAAALIGQIKSASAIGNMLAAANASSRYINSTVTHRDGVIEARLNLARYYIARNELDSARIEYEFVAKETKNAWAAEAKYNLAFIQYQNKDYKSCKKNIFDIADNYSNYEYWVAKAYLLLADVYVTEKDNFQAKATLQSIIENYDGEDLKNLATEKLRMIIANEESLKDHSKTSK